MEIPRHWRLKDQRYRMVGEICLRCENAIFPPRDVCPHCGGTDCQVPHQFSGKGEVYSFTDNNLAYIKLEEGPMITAQLTDFSSHTEVKEIDGEQREIQVSDAKIGEPVEMVTRKLRVDGNENSGLILYGYKFRPRLSSSR